MRSNPQHGYHRETINGCSTSPPAMGKYVLNSECCQPRAPCQQVSAPLLSLGPHLTWVPGATSPGCQVPPLLPQEEPAVPQHMAEGWWLSLTTPGNGLCSDFSSSLWTQDCSPRAPAHLFIPAIHLRL